MNNIIKVKNTKFRDALMNKQYGEIVYCENENKYYIWNDDWKEFNPEVKVNGGVEIKYRDLMESAVQGMEEISDKKMKDFKSEINKWANRQFYLLLNKTENYYTFFCRNTEETAQTFFDILLECIQSIGRLVYIEKSKEQPLYILWIKNSNNEVKDYYLFDYTEGTVYFK